MCRWRIIDESDGLHYYSKRESNRLYYRRIYTVSKNFRFSETNQFIHNLKIAPIPDNFHRMKHKRRAIQLFADALIEIFSSPKNSQRETTIVPIQPSKTDKHPEYDDRIEQVARLVSEKLSHVSCIPLLKSIEDRESYHTSRKSRKSEDIYSSLRLKNNLCAHVDEESTIVLLDDVIASGAHFIASRQLIEEAFPDTEIFGFFWAKAEYPNYFKIDIES